MLTSRPPRLGLALALLASLGAGLSQANAQDASLARGDAVVTGFSGIRPSDTPVPTGADPLDYFYIDLQGPSAEILSLSGLGAGPNGQLAPAPIKRQITAAQVGQVFGVTLDDGQGEGVPNIYLGATSAYGIQIVGPDKNGDGQPDRLKTGAPGAKFMAGQFGPAPDGAPGTIWRVDGTTGDVTAFATLPNNSGPGIGDVVFDKRTQQFFASDLDNGLIYRIAPDGTVVDSFDHGVSGLPAAGQPPIADNGQVMDITSPSFDSQNPATWGYTQKARMVWGLAVHNDRLYYAVAGDLQVWSVGINADGTFANDPRWELDAKALPGDGPITNILFDGQGRMLLAQRGSPRGAYDYSTFAEPGQSSVVRYHLETPDDPSTPSVWAPDADEYAIGMRPEFRNADGGIALGYRHDPDTGALVPGSCNATLWSTGSRLRSSMNPDTVDDGSSDADVHGLQGNDASLVRPQNVPPTQAYYIDYDGLFGDAANAGHMGDVAVWQPCDQQGFNYPGYFPPGYYPPGDVPPGFPPEFPPPRPYWHTNLRLTKHARGHCRERAGGFACAYEVRIKNTGPDPYLGDILISDHLPGTPSGALMAFGPQPPWHCWPSGSPSAHCWLPHAFLPAGATRHLFAVVWVPKATARRNHCRIRNVAHIQWAPGGSQWNTDPGDDADGASAVVPDNICRQRTNLTLRKVSRGCEIVSRSTAVCDYDVTVINAGPGEYHDPIKVEDTSIPGTTATFTGAPWSCTGSGPSYACVYPMAHLGAGDHVSFHARVRVPRDAARAHHCSIKNLALILDAPGGTPKNVNPGDDASFAYGSIPANFCAPQIAPAVKHCPPGYRYIRGACRRPSRVSPPVVRPPKRHCPQGTVRRGHRCVTIHRSCPQGTVRRNGRCIKVRQLCPKETVRRHGQCVKVQRGCPQGMHRRGRHCVPNVTRHICPKGTHRRGHRCVPNVQRQRVCPKGTVGKWPHCRKIQLKRPILRRPQTHGSLTHRPLVRFPRTTVGQARTLR